MTFTPIKVGSFLLVLWIATATVIVPFCHAEVVPPPPTPTNPPRLVKNDNQQPDHPIRPVKPTTPKPTKKPVVLVTAPPTLKPTNPPRPAKARGPTKFPTNTPTTPPTVLGCFSLRNTVEIEGKGVVPMKDIKVGDKVRDANGNMVTVYSLGHYKIERKPMFKMLQIHADGLLQPLELTGHHFIYVNGKPIAASNVIIGMKLDLGQVIGSSNHGVTATVRKIQPIMTSSFMSPKTTSGTIAVNGVAASSYTSALQNGSHLAVVGGVAHQMPFSKHWLRHMIQTPHRLMCTVRMDWCQAETFTDEGFSIYIDILVRPVLRWFYTPGWGLLKVVVLMVVLVLMQVLCVVEFIIMSWSNLSLAMVVALVGSFFVGATWFVKGYAVKKTKVKTS